MKLRAKGQYAVLAMVDLASHPVDRSVPLADIAERQSLPLSYLEQLFLKLRRANLVESARGQNGGYKLMRPPSDITVASILEAVDVTLKATRCDEKSEKSCMGASTRCMTHHLWAGLGDQMHSYLNAVSLEDVCHNKVPGPKVWRAT